jgi:hypothetical protein
VSSDGIKRYEMDYEDRLFRRADDGDYVEYTDHAAAIAAKDAEIAALGDGIERILAIKAALRGDLVQQYVDANEARIDAEARVRELETKLAAIDGLAKVATAAIAAAREGADV